MRAEMWTRVFDALVRVEDVTSDEAGLLHFGVDPANGGIFVEGGRICWAAARGMQQRLRDLLVQVTIERGLDLDEMCERCRDQGMLLGETLVDEGWVTAHELESALRRHSAESLIELCREDTLPIWTSRGGRGYAPRFTFRPLDVFFDVVSIHLAPLRITAERELRPLLAEDRRGAAFSLTRDAAIPIAAFGDLSLHAVWTLGRWASTLPAATRELGATPSFTLAATATGGTIGVWWHDALLYAIASDDRRSAAAIASHLASMSS